MESSGDSLLSPVSSMGNNDIENLKYEVKAETRYRDASRHYNKELEHSILDIEVKLLKPNESFETEWDNLISSQTTRNDALRNKNIILKEELSKLRAALKNERICSKECNMNHSDLEPNLDIMTESEILRTIKKLERAKIDLKSTLLNKEWTLDSLAKQYAKIKAQRDLLQSEYCYFRRSINKCHV